MRWNWQSLVFTSPKKRERDGTLALLRSVRARTKASPFHDDKTLARFIVDIIFEASEEYGGTPGVPLGEGLYTAIKGLLTFDSFLIDLPDDSDLDTLTVEESVRLRTSLRAHDRFLTAQERLLPIWKRKLVILFGGFLGHVPLSGFIDINEDGTTDDDSVVLPEARLYDLVDNLPTLLERTIATFYDEDIREAALFNEIRERFDSNLLTASGIHDDAVNVHPSKIVTPKLSKITDPSTLVDIYCQGTPFQGLFYRPIPFAIPFPARFEHTHIVGGTGHGKTQLMQFLIHHDLMRAMEDDRAVVVIDSQGDLIRTISSLGVFSSDSELRARAVLVDPNDVEYPVCLNMFDFNRDRLSGYAPVDREKILNATIELYEYFFGALLGAELTQRQGLIFKYLARLLIEIPDATIHTLRELMEDGQKFRPYMEKLQGTARSFFVTRFFDRQFNETKKQILTRLWGVLSNSSLERMFSHTCNKVDIFELLNQGKIVFINTAKDLLGQEGSAIFGRFFIALIAQAAIQRAAQPPHTRNPAFVYIDEAADYFDDNISHLLNTARKYRVGLIFAHQNMDQLSAGLRSSVLASTTIKFAGGLSAKDASLLDAEFRCDSDLLLNQKKGKHHTEFACYVKNYTSAAVSVSIPLGYVEAQRRITAHDYAELVDSNRALYSEPPLIPQNMPFLDAEVPEAKAPKPPKRPLPAPQRATAPVPEPEPERERDDYDEPDSWRPEVVSTSAPAPTSTPRPTQAPSPKATKPKPPPIPKEIAIPGRGGRQHKYLQQLVKQLGEARGFRASIEDTILDGAGRVDVSLIRDTERIAVQISVTTSRDWELSGIEKCFAAGYGEVILIASTEKHLKGLAKFIEENLDDAYQGNVRYVPADGIVDYLDSLGTPPPSEEVVRGYKVRTVHERIDPNDAAARRKAISDVIARSLKRSD